MLITKYEIRRNATAIINSAVVVTIITHDVTEACCYVTSAC